jgi:hypothetical protein
LVKTNVGRFLGSKSSSSSKFQGTNLVKFWLFFKGLGFSSGFDYLFLGDVGFGSKTNFQFSPIPKQPILVKPQFLVPIAK